MIKGSFAVMLAGSLMIPQPAVAGQSNTKLPGHAGTQAAPDVLSLPRIPHAETIPWLAATSAPRWQKPRLLLHPGSFGDLRLVLDRDPPKVPHALTSTQGGTNAGS
jgi:hypothetical protein